MNLDDLISSLEEHKALIVHMSHHANMREGGVFPDDLKNAMQKKDDWPLSCVVVWPNHTLFDLPGSVGVIFEPISVDNVISVFHCDSGSWADEHGDDNSAGVPLSFDSFKNTFVGNVPYNEWRVKGAKVVGIFVNNPNLIFVKKYQDILCDGVPVHNDIVCIQISLNEVIEEFNDFPVYTIMNNERVKLNKL
jgi:hypothetical protein